MKPLISIVLCTYNGERYIDEQVTSLLAQTYQPLEIIICDDASTDNSLGSLAKFSNDPGVKIFSNSSNKGLTASIQFALQQTTGAFIALCDQDDIWKLNKLELMMHAIGNDVLIYSDSELVDELGNDLQIKLSDLRNMHTGNNTLGFAFNNCVWGHAILFNRSLLSHILPIPGNMPHDSWIGFVAAAENRIVFLNTSLTMYRQHRNTVTSTLPQKYVSNPRLKEEDYLKRLDWLKALSAYPANPFKKEYQQLYLLFKQKQGGSFVFQLFYFLLKHRKLLFAFSKKSIYSQLNEIRKFSRGIKINGEETN
jgi:glycosyltransferase involved in cell wall biosynthesis